MANPSDTKLANKRDYATAILEPKKAPNRLVVDEATTDDNSLVMLGPKTMEALEFFEGDAVLIKGKKKRNTVCTVASDGTCEEPKIRMNKPARYNLRVRRGDV
ncbi:hypothetical protein RJ640_018617, partial [Escallonia rubra]